MKYDPDIDVMLDVFLNGRPGSCFTYEINECNHNKSALYKASVLANINDNNKYLFNRIIFCKGRLNSTKSKPGEKDLYCYML